MDPATVATIASLTGAAKTTVETVRLVLEKAKGRDAEKAAKEALGLVSELQTRILQLQEMAFRLQEENAQLRAQIRQKEEGTADRKRYETIYLGDSPVKVSQEDPEAYLCYTCFEAGRKVALSKLPADMGDVASHYCPKCKGIVGAP